MNASANYTATENLRIDDSALVLIGASSPAAERRAVRTVEASGFRSWVVPVADVAARLRVQVAAAAVWLELDEADTDLTAVLARVNQDLRTVQRPAIIAAPFARLDELAAHDLDVDAHLLIDADEGDRLASLATATAAFGVSARTHELAKEPSSERLRQLSDEVSRIAATLARLSSSSNAGFEAPVRPAREERPVVQDNLTSEVVRSVIRARRLRTRFFDADLFADPAWDMLLDLLAAEIAQFRVPVSSLCIAAVVPPTTALRWIKSLTDRGLFIRRPDPRDARRVFIELSRETSAAMHRYFSEVGTALAV